MLNFFKLWTFIAIKKTALVDADILETLILG